MKTASIRELRTAFPKLEAGLQDGEDVQITRRGRPVARLVPAGRESDQPLVKVDFLAQIKATWGDRHFGVEEVAAMREAELAAEEGLEVRP